MIKVLDLFSGIGGNTLALSGFTKTIAYCEFDKHAQAVLISRMNDGMIPPAKIFSDVKNLCKKDLDDFDMIVAGFPCQDISCAGKGAGIASGSRSGLFFEIMRIADETKPKFIFLENVPAIRTRGLNIVLQELTKRGYDCRWTMLSAAQVGAKHKRERWFLLANSNEGRLSQTRPKQHPTGAARKSLFISDASKQGLQGGCSPKHISGEGKNCEQQFAGCDQSEDAWTIESRLGGMVDGISDWVDRGLPNYLTKNYWQEEPQNIPRVTNKKEQRVERIKRLGNSVVPLQARTAFLKLMASQWGSL
jgi:DNA (cytosine-5)-methyltransferase 1